MLGTVLDGVPESMVIGLTIFQGVMPEAFESGGKLVGVVTTLGFVTAFVIHQLD